MTKPIGKLANGQPLVRGKYPVLYLSGRHVPNVKVEKEWLEKTGCTHRCYSYAYVGPGAFYYKDTMEMAMWLNIKRKVGIMLDSGAFSFHRFIHSKAMKKKKYTEEQLVALRWKTIDDYVKYVLEHGNKMDFYVNFDYVIDSPKIYEVQKMLQKKGIWPAPVVHGDKGLDWLRRYIDMGHKLINVGCPVWLRSTWKDRRYYLDNIFNITEKAGVYCHGLAFTSLTLMYLFPWYSVDSATWAKVSAFGHILVPDTHKNVIHNIHVSDHESKHQKDSYNRMSKPNRRRVERIVEDHGFDFGKVRSDPGYRCIYNGWIFQNIHQYADLISPKTTTTWEKLF